MSTSWLWRVAGIALAACAATSPATGQEAAPSPPGPPMRIVLAADLDCEAAVVAFESALREVATLRSSLVVIEFHSNDARLDLVNRLGVAIRDAGVPTAAWIDGGDDARAGPGALTMALFAERVIVRERAAISGSVRGQLEALAENDVPWEIVAGELRERVAGRFPERPDRDAVAALLTGQAPTAFLAPETPVAKFHATDSPPAGARAVTRNERDRVVLTLAAKDLKAAGLAEAVARDWSAAARHLSLPRRVEERRIDTSAAGTRDEAIRTIEKIEAAFLECERTLDLPDSSQGRLAPKRYRDAGQKAQSLLAEAGNAITRVEASLQSVPEALRLPAPGQGLLEKPSSYATKWRSTIRTLRGDLADLERKAKDFAAR